MVLQWCVKQLEVTHREKKPIIEEEEIIFLGKIGPKPPACDGGSVEK